MTDRNTKKLNRWAFEKLPVMSDTNAARLRQWWVSQGTIIPGINDGQGFRFMTPQEVQKYRQNLIAKGFLIPRSSKAVLPRRNVH